MTKEIGCRIKIQRKMANDYNLLQDVNSKHSYDLLDIEIDPKVQNDTLAIHLRIEALSPTEFNVYTIRDDLEIVEILDNYSHGLNYRLQNKTSQTPGVSG